MAATSPMCLLRTRNEVLSYLILINLNVNSLMWFIERRWSGAAPLVRQAHLHKTTTLYWYRVLVVSLTLALECLDLSISSTGDLHNLSRLQLC